MYEYVLTLLCIDMYYSHIIHNCILCMSISPTAVGLTTHWSDTSFKVSN